LIKGDAWGEGARLKSQLQTYFEQSYLITLSR
jgi:hypothetical protein